VVQIIDTTLIHQLEGWQTGVGLDPRYHTRTDEETLTD
jgi:hypothetical protein